LAVEEAQMNDKRGLHNLCPSSLHQFDGGRRGSAGG